uniref:Uncharacterized protein n=1 Tax=Moniliophthora roreri TaxID=221103 RepID=A0A0W0FDF6_MONRR
MIYQVQSMKVGRDTEVPQD